MFLQNFRSRPAINARPPQRQPRPGNKTVMTFWLTASSHIPFHEKKPSPASVQLAKESSMHTFPFPDD
ncbi:MAG TPA: hypothetical protein DEP07_03085 [Brevibacillus sp.]|nr:hypothetical protein EDM60_22545 [Brevibacillus parabrevis]HBZ79343.1 hypothetical protein [Brevibacillus sp.]